eukprot:GEMP01011674.1.p1 GENE.GEMP01011674.1~~GEMP01011674.1.p1  ORF type:complete len:548 (+),score=97.07 GEMP01011674.1:202-1845(+)
MLFWLALVVCGFLTTNAEVLDARNMVEYADDSHLDPQFRRRLQRFTNAREFGHRSDCALEDCPKRFADCGVNDSEIAKISVFLVLHDSLCKQYENLRECINVGMGAFKDANLLFESQLGIHLSVDFVLSPEALLKSMPDVARASNGKDMTMLFKKYLKVGGSAVPGGRLDQCAGLRSVVFWDATKHKVEDFGIYHIMHGFDDNTMITSATSSDARPTLCTCTSASASSYLEARISQNWIYLAIAIGKLFNSQRTVNDVKLDGKFMFSDSDRPLICSEIKKAMTDTEARQLSGCVTRYYQGPTIDPRFSISYGTMIVLFVVLSLALFLAIMTAAWYVVKARQHNLKYTKLQRAYLTHEATLVADSLKKSNEDPSNRQKVLRRCDDKSPTTPTTGVTEGFSSPGMASSNNDNAGHNAAADDADNYSDRSEPVSRRRRARKHAKFPRPGKMKADAAASPSEKLSKDDDRGGVLAKGGFHVPRIDRKEALQAHESCGSPLSSRKSLASLSSFHSGKMKKIKPGKKNAPRVLLGFSPELQQQMMEGDDEENE